MSGTTSPPDTTNLPAMVVEDGSIVAGANSYATLAYANAYMAANIHGNPQWLALTQLEQQALLIWATRYLDQRATWNGITATAYLYREGGVNVIDRWAVHTIPPNFTPQVLRWPRFGVWDIDNNPIWFNQMPKQLLDATCEMARYLIAQDRSLERPQDGLTELKVDVLSIKFLPDYELPQVPDQISFMIRGLGSISSGRTYGAKIRRA